MPLINTADALYLGATPVDRLYKGSTLVWEAGGPPPGVVYTDDFNRANGSLGAGWNAPSWEIFSNEAWRNGNANDWATFLTDLGSPDMYAEMDVVGAGIGEYIVVNVRQDGTFNNVAYMAFWNPATSQYNLGKTTPGYTLMATAAAGSSFTGRIRLEVSGTNPVHLVMKVDNVTVITYDDVAGDRIQSGQYAGMNASPSAGAVDNFECGTL